MRTLTIDIGGTGIKGLVLDAEGRPLTERARVRTPKPATPETLFTAIEELVKHLIEFDRVAVGFPGVVTYGITRTAPNLGTAFKDFQLATELGTRLGCPVRVINDAGLQGYGVIEGKGTEILITLGTGMGFALYIDGHYVPNIELAHHPFKKNKTYEERLGDAERKRIGKAKWNKRVLGALAQLEPIFNFQKLYLGGGNVKYVDKAALPPNVTVVQSEECLRGGVRLWSF